jgi:CubicO group peptidase (beta-lactamase class C family)
MKKIFIILLIISSTSSLAKNKTLKDHGFLVNDKTPAFGLLVIKNGKTVFKDVGGCARFDKHKNCVLKATNETSFSIQSVTKHFLTAGILILEEEGNLSIEDEITKYLDLPKQFKGIKIKHLIFHTSGIPDFWSKVDFDFSIMEKNKEKLTIEKIIAIIKTLEPQPHGIHFSYSNSAYVLLGEMVAKVSNQKLEQFLKSRIFDKFDMKNAFMSSSIENQKNYILPYSPWPVLKEESWPKIVELTAEGGIWMSLDDYEKWINAFDNNKIFKKKETMKKYLSRGKFNDGSYLTNERAETEGSYGFGIALEEITNSGKKYNTLSHNGGFPGVGSNFTKFIDQNIWVVNCNNNASYPDAFDLLKMLNITI